MGRTGSDSLPLIMTTLMTTIMMMMTHLMVTAANPRAFTCAAITTTVDTTVVCDFGVDIKKTENSSFVILFYYPDFNANPETTLTCALHRPGDIICDARPDVIFNKAVSDHILFTRAPAVDKVGGQYTCHLVPALGANIEPCTLLYKELPTTSTPSSTLPPTTEKDEDDKVLPLLTVTFVFVLLVVLLFSATAVIVCLVIYLKRERIRQWWTGHSKKRDVEDPAEPDPLESPHTHTSQDQPGNTCQPFSISIPIIDYEDEDTSVDDGTTQPGRYSPSMGQKKKAEKERKKAKKERVKQERKKAEEERKKQEKKEKERIAKEEKEAQKKADKEAKEAKRKGEGEKSESVTFLSATTDQPGFERIGQNRDLAQVHFSTANKQGKGVVTSII